MFKSESVLLSGPLQTKRLSDGRRELLRDLVVSTESGEITVPAGFKTDFSSYPRITLIVLLVLLGVILEVYTALEGESVIFLLLLIIPRFSRVDVAGVVHDYLYYTGEQPKLKADWIWLHIATSGAHRAYWWQAIPSWFFGLVLFGCFVWWKHRSND